MSDARGKNEGAVDLSYKPPKSMKKLASLDEGATDAGFEWDTLNSNLDIDVWAIRIPAGLKPADLAGLKIKLPSSGSADVTGTFKKGDSNYRLQSVDEDDTFGGEEMQNLSCLVPKEGDGGALYTIPRPFKRLILAREDPTPTSPLSAPSSEPTRRPQPFDRLKHAFAPIGSEPVSPPPSAINADQPAEIESPKKKHKKNASIKVEAEGAKKNKNKGKPKDKEPQPEEEAMDVDDITEVLPIKKSKKKSNRTDVQADATDTTLSVKKEKKKRKAAEEE
ncbi:unnamed protein product [Rhizoctonia solani]|uniref:DNA-directed RNA polymerase I subunit RPA34 n=1 Tax=Rhizoctonia solani TaxID=456999 RepID=A0A8H2XWF5_9AGAM|nr:unnamed protein product [Rhizoctonia solani]